MTHGYLATVLDLSLPVGAGQRAAQTLGRGVTAALKILEEAPRLRLEVALAGAVTLALLRWGEERSLQLLAERAAAGQVTFLTTACFGAFLPLVPGREAARQLDLCERVNRDALGEAVYRPEGLFPPQLGYSRTVAELARRRGYGQVLADGLAWQGGAPLPRERHFTLRDKPGLHVFFVDRALSEALAQGAPRMAEIRRRVAPRAAGGAVVRLPASALIDDSAALRFLGALAVSDTVLPASLEDLLALFSEREQVEPLASALGTDPVELASGVQFAKWSAPGNELHALLWRLAQIASGEAARLEEAGTEEAPPGLAALRARLDESLDCSAWLFASGKPELDLARVYEGGRRLLEAVRAGGADVRPSALAQAEHAWARLERRVAEIALEPAGAHAP